MFALFVCLLREREGGWVHKGRGGDGPLHMRVYVHILCKVSIRVFVQSYKTNITELGNEKVCENKHIDCLCSTTVKCNNAFNALRLFYSTTHRQQ